MAAIIGRSLRQRHALTTWNQVALGTKTLKYENISSNRYQQYFISPVSTRWWICRTYATHKFSDEMVINLSQIPTERIRNFSIIAHVDHGKSTLADRLLEFTSTINATSDNKQVLDNLQVERERGITVKAQTASMFHTHTGSDETYLLNLIDTPGHVDFSYEVSRSLSACQGVLLLVDANQGVQAQTLANFYLAFENDLEIIPVINKIDLKNAKPVETALQMQKLFDIDSTDILKVSAKLGTGVQELLDLIIDKIPPPPGDLTNALKCLIFDSYFTPYLGAIINVAVVDGCVRKGDKITAAHRGKSYTAGEVGIMYPHRTETGLLQAGQVGYIIPGMKNAKEALIGDTIHHTKYTVDPLPGFKPVKPMVYAGMFPMDSSQYPAMKNAMEKLVLNDSSVSIEADNSPALGMGWRLGFLGLLHMEVFNQRLEQEFNANLLATTPSVCFKARLKGQKVIKAHGGEEVISINNPSMFPDKHKIEEFLEPFVTGTIITPEEYCYDITSLCMDCRGRHLSSSYIDEQRMLLKFALPLSEIIVDFYDRLKSFSSGYASFDYEDLGYEPAPLIKLNILLNGSVVEELSTIVHESRSLDIGKHLCLRLKENIPRQLYEVIIQASVESQIISRETVKALKKNVLAKCYGGDVTRKMKLLKRQAEGKKKMKMFGNISVPKEAFIAVLKRS